MDKMSIKVGPLKSLGLTKNSSGSPNSSNRGKLGRNDSEVTASSCGERTLDSITMQNSSDGNDEVKNDFEKELEILDDKHLQ